MGYWKWLWGWLKGFILGLIGMIPRKIGTPYQEYMIGSLTFVFSLICGLIMLAVNLSIGIYLLVLSVTGFFFGSHGYYRDRVGAS